MALTEKLVSIKFVAKDEVTGATTRITKNIGKNLTKLTRAFTEVSKEAGVTTKVTRTFASSQKNMGQQVKVASTALAKFGRRMVFTGFILSAVTRRITRAFKGIMNTFAGVIKEGADVDKQLDWLGSTIEALAFGGADLEQEMGYVMAVFDRAFSASGDLREELAQLDTHFLDIKTTINEQTIPFLENFNDTLDELDWQSITDGIGDAVDAFYEGLQPAFEALVTDENLLTLMDDLETLGAAAGSFSGGFVDGIADMIETLGDINNILGGDDTGIKGLAWWAGEATSKLALIAIPVIVIGTLINAVATIVGALGGIPGIITITLVLLGAKFLIDLQKARDKLDEIWGGVNAAMEAQSEAGIEEGSDFPYEGPTVPGGTARGPYGGGPDLGFEERLKDPFKPYVPPVGDSVRDAFERLQQRGGRQWGGLIAETGMYRLHKGEYVQPVHGRGGGGDVPIQVTIPVYVDGRKISETVSRHMGRRVRSTRIIV